MPRKLIYALLSVCMVSSLAFSQKDTVTFQVNMSVKWREGKFLPASNDTVRVVGNFQGWNAADPSTRMVKGASDSIYSVTLALDSATFHKDTLFYKFFKTARGGDWESDPNRVYKLVAGKHTLPVAWFDRDSVVNALVSVTFRVNMAIKTKELTFQPQNGDIVRVAGSFNDWGNSTDTLKKGASDSIYSKTVTMNEGDAPQYKFLKTIRGGLDWEGGNNRAYTVPVGGGPVPVAYFDYDSVFNATVQTNVLWQTDITPLLTIGWFDNAKDSVDVRGGFNGWGGQTAKPNPLNPNIWEFTSQNQILPIGDQQQYKFHIKADSAGAVGRFPGLVWGGTNDNRDGFFYEHPAERGDGNNLYSVVNSTNQGPQRNFWAGINPIGLFGATDSANVTIKVNMGPATRYSNPFNPAADTLWLVWQDAIWRSGQAKNQGTFPSTIRMTRQGATDSVFVATFKVKGKTHYNLQYTYRYKRTTDLSVVDQGGGLGGQNPYITRFIRSKFQGKWYDYTVQQDEWKKDAPLVGDSAPFTTAVDASPSVPGTYELLQNYPNPFNPTTTIRFSLAQQGVVRLRVFNLLGQQIAELVNEVKSAGTHVVGFDASRYASGVYFYKLEAGSFTDIKKMVLLK